MDYIFQCIKCGAILDDNIESLCEECDKKEGQKINLSKKSRAFKRTDNKKDTHRTKKRKTKPRKEVNKNNE